MSKVSIGLIAVLAGGLAPARSPFGFAATDARLTACVERDGSNAHIMACTSVAQVAADARLNGVYQAWIGALKHPKPEEAKDDAEILKRLVAAERAWIAFRDDDCNLRSTSALGGTAEPVVFGDCRYAMTKARVEALEADRSAR